MLLISTLAASLALTSPKTLTAESPLRSYSFQESLLYEFQGGHDGAGPRSALLLDATGAFYSSTAGGGGKGCNGLGCGTVFKLTPSGSTYSERVLHEFGGGHDGVSPSGLIVDAYGALYGTTSQGGSRCGTAGCGTVFQLTPAGKDYKESVLYRFKGYPGDGEFPVASLIEDKSGALYGTTSGGGTYNNGTVFKLTRSRSGFSESILYSFRGGNDGASPQAGLIADASGVLYGTTIYGGVGTECFFSSNGSCGTVFKLMPSGSGYNESVIYSFRGSPKDGAGPTAGLVTDEKGALYSTTFEGGSGTGCKAAGCGTIFKLTPRGTYYNESLLYSFQGGQDGETPYSGVLQGTAGAFYGTTEAGGGFGSTDGYGTVFMLTPVGKTYTESILHSFQGARSDGATPWGGLVTGATGALYGTCSNGGDGCDSFGCGTVFKLAP